MKSKKFIISLISLCIIFFIGGGFLTPKLNFFSSSIFQDFWKEKEAKEKAEVITPSPLPSRPLSFVQLAEKEKPAVVNISTTKLIKRRGLFRQWRSRPPFEEKEPFGEQEPWDPFEEFFERFFGGEPKGDIKEKSLGSGFVLDKEGYILTNEHVIERAEEIKVKLANGKEYMAKVVGKDSKTDVALIKIDSKDDLPVVNLGDSDKLRVGEWVLAIGNPFGLEHTVTAGIVSAKGRVIGQGPYDDFIQTDASINPGNSGGPLFNTSAEVVGINSAIYAGGQGIGFAIPINIAKDLLLQLKTTGKVVRGWLGVYIQEVTLELAKSFGLEKNEGALVADVIKDGPAEKAGIERGDVITEFDGKKVHDSRELTRIVAATDVGKGVEVKVVRNGKEKAIPVKIAEYPAEEVAFAPSKEELDIGATVEELTPSLARRFGINEEEGVVVSDVKPGSPADEAGLREGDMILELNKKRVKNLDDYRQSMRELEKGSPVLMLVKRGDNTIYVAIKTKS